MKLFSRALQRRIVPSALDVQTMGPLFPLSVNIMDSIAATLVECDNVLRTRQCVGEKNISVPSESPSTTTSVFDFGGFSMWETVLRRFLLPFFLREPASSSTDTDGCSDKSTSLQTRVV